MNETENSTVKIVLQHLSKHYSHKRMVGAPFGRECIVRKANSYKAVEYC